MSTPKISIIIPVYNAEDHVRQALDSVLSQSLKEIEVICVDDGSTDHSLDILKEYENADSRVHVLQQQNRYAGVARNLGLSHAAGEYIHFLDADDYVLNYAYEALYYKAVKYDIDILRCACAALDMQRNVFVDDPQITLTCLRTGDFNRVILPDPCKSPRDILLQEVNTACWGGLFRRSFLQEEEHPDVIFDASDVQSVYHAIAERMPRILFARDRLVVHRLYPDSTASATATASSNSGGNDRDPALAPACFREMRLFHNACQHPKVSIAVPIYNVEDYLNEALYSLTVQDMEELEFICVNDGSTDHSLIILKEYAALDERIRILDGPNGGYGKGMNRAMDAAIGEYLGILEPDDFVPSDMFSSLYDIAHRNRLDFVKSDFCRFTVNRDGSLNSRRENLTANHSYYNRVICPAKEKTVFTFPMNTWSGIYRMAFLNHHHIRHNETPGASYQDNGLWFKTFCLAKRAWFSDRAFYMNRRDNPNSSMFSKSKVYCMTEEYNLILDWLNENPALKEQFIRQYHHRKFNNFMTTYWRLAPEYQLEYLHHIRDEFREPMEQGLLERSLFTDISWQRLHEIVADPDGYYEKFRVSVIMPVYNAATYLRQALDSLLVRNELQFEVICVDDGSTDESLQILREYEEKDNRVRVYTQENAGAGAARNLGMRHARGEYLSFLDADDFFDSSMLRMVYDQAHYWEADIVVFRSDVYNEDTDTYTAAGYTIDHSLLPKERPFAGADIERNVFRAFKSWAWDKLFRADFVRENGLQFQELKATNDLFFVFSAILKAKRITTYEPVLIHYRKHTSAVTLSRQGDSWGCFYRALSALQEQLRDWDMLEQRQQDFSNYCVGSCLWNMNSLRGPAFYQLYDRLTAGGWLDDLGVTGHESDYFYNQGEYQNLLLILQSEDAESYLFNQRDAASAELSRVRAERDRKKRDLTAERNGRTAAEQELTRTRNSRSYRLFCKPIWEIRQLVKRLKQRS